MAESTSETPVLDLLTSMTADSITASSLDTESVILARIATVNIVKALEIELEVAEEHGEE